MPAKKKQRLEKEKENVQVLLAQKFDEGKHDPVGFWISEKLDGLRAFWNGSALFTRNGLPITTPKWFTQGWPSLELDGELFIGRKMFNETSSIVRKQSESKENDLLWRSIKYMVFDMPSLPNLFEERMMELKSIASKLEFIKFVDQTVCLSKEHLHSELKRVLNLGGEGLMLREPKSMYIPKRSPTLLKVKVMMDAEATVIGYKMGKGKNSKVVGSLECEMKDGSVFFVGTGLSDEERQNPPKIGSCISYSYQELTPAGLPRFPSFRGVCVDR